MSIAPRAKTALLRQSGPLRLQNPTALALGGWVEGLWLPPAPPQWGAERVTVGARGLESLLPKTRSMTATCAFECMADILEKELWGLLCPHLHKSLDDRPCPQLHGLRRSRQMLPSLHGQEHVSREGFHTPQS